MLAGIQQHRLNAIRAALHLFLYRGDLEEIRPGSDDVEDSQHGELYSFTILDEDG